MARHTSFGGRNPGKPGLLDGGMAIAAIDSIILHMMLMTERHRLLDGHPHAGCPRRPVSRISRPDEPKQSACAPDQRRSGQCITTASKDLGHPIVLLLIISVSTTSPIPGDSA